MRQTFGESDNSAYLCGMENVFHFKQFDVAQDRCAMKIGTDGVLLGALAELDSIIPHPSSLTPHRILDIGTGTGLVALMMAQRLSDAGVQDFHIDAVEIDHNAAEQAQENVAKSPWSEKIEVHAMALEVFMAVRDERFAISGNKYNLIVSNPPFYNATLKPEDEARAVARHKDSLPLKQIMECARTGLSEQGRLVLIHPMNYDQEVMTEAVLAGLSPIHLWNILTKVGKPCKRRITTFALPSGATPLIAETLSLRDENNDYSSEYRTLTGPFYISLK